MWKKNTGTTVKEVLNLPILRQAKVLSGHKGLDRVIQFIDIMEVPELKGWVKEGVLILTTAYAIRNEPLQLTELVRILHASGGAALAIKPTRFCRGFRSRPWMSATKSNCRSLKYRRKFRIRTSPGRSWS
ncbi:hypothetical protein HMSSN036_86160 [Paenibacillus macerans]|nr:hypothetical protein HMSSN036_86160 [Paenibacillus macerans]